MKTVRLLVTLSLACIIIPSYALMPPSYLSVKKWKSCVSTYKKGTAEFICMPNSKTIDCPKKSWEQLTEMSNLPNCPGRFGEEDAQTKDKNSKDKTSLR